MSNAQNLTVLLGKMLRIAPSTTPGVGGYTIPASNPFAGSATNRQEIFAYGLRNPFRDSFDRGTGNLYIGDVGQSTREEVDFIPNGPGGVTGGQNLGWRRFEGNILTPGISDTSPNAMDVLFPVYDYPHANGNNTVIGGYVYRGGEYPRRAASRSTGPTSLATTGRAGSSRSATAGRGRSAR